MGKRVAMMMVVALASATTASAQSSTTGSGSATSPSPSIAAIRRVTQPHRRASVDTRPATTTTNGDTGLWFVPTGEIVPAKKYALSVYRVNFDRDQGFTDVSDWPVTFAFGAGDRAEIFGAWTLVRRIDRDVRPLFVPTQAVAGGLVNEAPFVRQGWSDNQLGDLWLGAKINLTSQWRQQPAAFAVRGMIKLPTAKTEDEGVGTGKMDFALDAIVSKEVNERVEVSGYGGFIVRGRSGRDRSGQRAALGIRRRGAVAQEPALHGGTARRELSERHGDDHGADAVAAGGRGRERCRRDNGSDLAGERDVRVDVAGEERGVCGRRDHLEPAHGRPRAVS